MASMVATSATVAGRSIAVCSCQNGSALRRLEERLDTAFEHLGDLERQRQARIMATGFDRIDDLARYTQTPPMSGHTHGIRVHAASSVLPRHKKTTRRWFFSTSSLIHRDRYSHWCRSHGYELH